MSNNNPVMNGEVTAAPLRHPFDQISVQPVVGGVRIFGYETMYRQRESSVIAPGQPNIETKQRVIAAWFEPDVYMVMARRTAESDELVQPWLVAFGTTPEESDLVVMGQEEPPKDWDV